MQRELKYFADAASNCTRCGDKHTGPCDGIWAHHHPPGSAEELLVRCACELEHVETLLAERGWQPIETAPDDVRAEADLCCGELGRTRLRTIMRRDGTIACMWTGHSPGDPVTHYCALPEPPK